MRVGCRKGLNGTVRGFLLKKIIPAELSPKRPRPIPGRKCALGSQGTLPSRRSSIAPPPIGHHSRIILQQSWPHLGISFHLYLQLIPPPTLLQQTLPIPPLRPPLPPPPIQPMFLMTKVSYLTFPHKAPWD